MKTQNLRLHPDLLCHNPHFTKMSRYSVCTVTFKKHCPTLNTETHPTHPPSGNSSKPATLYPFCAPESSRPLKLQGLYFAPWHVTAAHHFLNVKEVCGMGYLLFYWTQRCIINPESFLYSFASDLFL